MNNNHLIQNKLYNIANNKIKIFLSNKIINIIFKFKQN